TPNPPQPVQFEERPHPHDPTRTVATEVRPVTGLPRATGEVARLEAGFAFIHLFDGRKAFFGIRCASANDLKVGDVVECMVVPGRDTRMFALSVDRLPEGMPASSPKSSFKALGVASLKGTRPTSSVNEDGFLVQPLAGGE